MQIVRKLEMRTRSWRRGLMGRRSFEEVVVVVTILNGQMSNGDHGFPHFQMALEDSCNF